jgi:exopolysaccharide biosynthesis protein
MTGKYIRTAIGYKDNKIYLVVANKATVPELAIIMQTLGMEYALNLDGGYSTALYYNDEYMIGPGRNIPNAIIFAKKN